MRQLSLDKVSCIIRTICLPYKNNDLKLRGLIVQDVPQNEINALEPRTENRCSIQNEKGCYTHRSRKHRPFQHHDDAHLEQWLNRKFVCQGDYSSLCSTQNWRRRHNPRSLDLKRVYWLAGKHLRSDPRLGCSLAFGQKPIPIGFRPCLASPSGKYSSRHFRSRQGLLSWYYISNMVSLGLDEKSCLLEGGDFVQTSFFKRKDN